MNKIIIGLIFLLTALPAFALPGQKYSDVEEWIKNHEFLVPWTEGHKEPGSGVIYQSIAFRELKDHWFVDVFFNSIWSEKHGVDFKDRTIHTDEIMLIKKKFVKKESEANKDNRQWENIECKNIWQRENSVANDILLNVYGEKVADDFRRSKLVFDGVDFTPSNAYEYPNFEHDVQKKVTHIQNFGISSYHPVKIYAGKEYYYEAEVDAPYYNFLGSSGKISCSSLTIISLGGGANYLKSKISDQKAYDQWKLIKSNRVKPANIEIEESVKIKNENEGIFER